MYKDHLLFSFCKLSVLSFDHFSIGLLPFTFSISKNSLYIGLIGPLFVIILSFEALGIWPLLISDLS